MRSLLNDFPSLSERSWLNRLLAATFSLLMIAAASAAESKPGQATLQLPSKTELLVLDGTNVRDLDFKVTADKPIALSNERHQIVFQLSAIVSDGGERNQFVSKPFILTFHPKPGGHYKLDVPVLRTMRQAQAIDNNPTSKITLKDAKGGAVPFEFAILPSKGIQLGRNYATDVQKFNRTDNPAAATEYSGMGTFAEQNTGFANATQNEAIYGGAANKNDDAQMSASMLRYWFKKADPKTQKAFVNWAREQVSQ
ncbi:DUF2057 domain-containing protein [Endozoicomonas sp. 4G]|uniref:YccT family protein n=1 Tax=Endozoicomonas sp. 4G TaxID=2872754 RepID=UPI0020786F3E|nr:DUF2057 domain-containing protein [Endozoicomonas sp. 4G]